MRLTYQNAAAVSIGKAYQASVFVLENSWELEVVDSDKRLQDAVARQPKPASSPTPTPTGITRFQ